MGCIRNDESTAGLITLLCITQPTKRLRYVCFPVGGTGNENVTDDPFSEVGYSRRTYFQISEEMPCGDGPGGLKREMES